MKNLNKVIKTAEHFKVLHKDEVSSIGFQTIVDMLKASEAKTYSINDLKSEIHDVFKNHDLDVPSCLSLEIKNCFGKTRYELNCGYGIYLRDLSSPTALLKNLDAHLKSEKPKILKEIAEKNDKSNIELS